MNIRRIVAVAGAAMLGLVAKPSAGASYTDVSYITTSAANQDWVLLNYTPKASTILEATVEIPASRYGQTHTLFCARGNDTADHPFVCFISSAKNWRFDFNENGVYKQGGAYDADTPYLIRAEASGFYVDGVKVVTPTTVPADFEAANKLVLFASYTAASSAVEPIANNSWSEIKVYGVRIWEGSQTEENLIHDLRPCSDSNGKFCLRDAKNGDTPYYSRGVKGFGGPALSLSVAIVDEDIGVPHLTATDAGPDATVSFQVSRSADGPWEEFATVPSTERGTAEADDKTADVGVPLYYRAECDVPGIGASPVVSITRLCHPLYISMKAANCDWVLLNYTPNSNTIFEATVEIPASRYGQTHTLFCARGNDTADHPFVCFISSAKNWRFDFNEDGSKKQGGTYAADTPYLVRAEASGLYVDGVRVVTPSPAPNFKAANKLVLFASYKAASREDEPKANASWSEIKVYGVRIWEGEKTDDKLLYDLRPYKDENGRYCLRDAKNGDKLYYSLGNGFGGYVADLKVSVEDFGSCVPQVKLLGLEDEVTDVTLQYARSAEGPWTTFASAAASTGGYVKAANPDAVVGVAMYYRASYVQAGVQCFSSPVLYTRFRRLERDPANERGGLAEGCSTPLEWGTADYTNGVRTAFDGKPETFPDTSPFGKIDGATKVGIDFGEEGAYVACVRALPRYSFTSRMNGAKLYAADDTDLSDAVAVSPALSCSGTYTEVDAQAGRVPFSVVYAQDASVPHRFYYLYKDGWYGDVAEMQLYGWTSKDQKQSGELIPPAVLVERGGEVGSVVISWTGGSNIETCDVRRRVSGTEEWTTAASGLTGSTYTDTGLDIDQHYEYQVVAHGHGETLAGEVKPIYLYAVGDGTGLRGVIWGPIASASCMNNQTKQCTYHEFRTDATIDFNREVSAAVLYAATNLTSGLVIWRGKLVVPTDGNYTIGIEVGAYDGYALTIGETEFGNRYGDTSVVSKSATIALTAGEHPIEVQWASRAYSGVRKCRLFWALEGKIFEETIPATQLKPAADSELPVYYKDGLNFAFPLGAYGTLGQNWPYQGANDNPATIPYLDGPFADGTCRIRSRGNGISTQTMPVFGRPVKGPFRAELTVRKGESDSDCYPGLYVAGSSPIINMVGFVVNPANCGVNMCPAHSPNVHMGGFGAWMKGNGTQTETKLRVTRDKEGTLHFRCRNEATGNKWVECYTYIGGTNCVDESGTQGTGLCTLTSETLYVGFGGCGTKSVAHDLKIQEGTPGLVLLLR